MVSFETNKKAWIYLVPTLDCLQNTLMSRLRLQYGNKMLTLLILSCCLMGLTSARSRQQRDDDLIVQTAKGKVRGTVSRAANGRRVDSFLGIPYAKPPIGEYRFRHPKPIDPWNGVLNATKNPNSCFQIIDEFYGKDFAGSKMWNPNTAMNEDCLYLNIWVPRTRPEKLTVMVWIYGGGFYGGTSTLDVYDGKLLASEENVVVVSMNYRVASLGFLHIGGRYDAPGNAGLFDQVMALEWVRDNVEFFGGSPNDVTLFGESAGAASVSMHLLSSLSRHLFKYAIIQSGSVLAPWVFTDRKELERRGLNLAKVVGCPEDSIDIIMKCLRKVHPSKLVNNEFLNYGVVEFPFTPIIDGAFLDSPPEEALRKGNYKKTSILAGSNTEEGFYYAMYYLPKLLALREDIRVSRKQFREAVRKLHPHLNDLSINAIIFQYTDWAEAEDPISNRDMIDKLVGDYNFGCPVDDFSLKYAQDDNDVYLYHYTHRYSTHPYPKWTGVLHGDEVPIIFGDPFKSSKKYQTSEVKFSKAMMKYWANFARTGNPNGEMLQSLRKPYWKKHTPKNREYMVLGTKIRMANRGPRVRECAFWKEYLPQLIEAPAHMPVIAKGSASILNVTPIYYMCILPIIRILTQS